MIKTFEGECIESVDGSFEDEKGRKVNLWKLAVATSGDHCTVFYIPYTHPEHDGIALSDLQGKPCKIEAVSTQGSWDPERKEFLIKWKFNRLLYPVIEQ